MDLFALDSTVAFEQNGKSFNRQPAEIFSRVCGFLRPTSQWNDGKLSEFKSRKTFKQV